MGMGDCASEREICPQTGKPHRALSLGPGIGWVCLDCLAVGLLSS